MVSLIHKWSVRAEQRHVRMTVLLEECQNETKWQKQEGDHDHGDMFHFLLCHFVAEVKWTEKRS